MRVQDDTFARPHLVRRAREKHAPGPRVPLQGRNREMGIRGDDLQRQVIHGVDVAPRRLRRARVRLDEIEVHAVGPVVRPAHEHDHAGIALAGIDEGRTQAFALRRPHGTVVERKVQVTDAAFFLVPDIAVTGDTIRRDFRERRHMLAKQVCGWQFEGVCGVLVAQVSDPDRPVHRGAADGVAASRDHPAGLASQAGFGAGIVEKHLAPEQPVADAGKSVRAVDLAQHDAGVVALPVDGSIGLLHQRPPPPAHLRVTVVQWHGPVVASLETVQRGSNGLHGCLGHLVAIKAGLGGRPHGELAGSPDIAGIHLRVGLQHRDAPRGLTAENRPVQRRRTAVTGNPRVDHQANAGTPDRLRDRAL